VTINVKCECGREHSADEAMAGRTFACDGCGREVKVPAAGAAGDLVTQMRAVQAERASGAPADAEAARRDGEAAARLGAAKSGVPRARPKARPPMDAYARAAHHLGAKKVLWIPALVVGSVCAILAVVCLVAGPWLLVTIPELTSGQGRFGPIFTEPGEDGLEKKWELVEAEDGKRWLIEDGTEALEWKDGKLMALKAFGDQLYQLKSEPVGKNENYVALSAAAEARASAGKRYLIFGPIFLVIGPVLLFLSLWMRRDIRLVAEAEKAETAEQPEKAEKTTESA
jgi:hypothetical protein